MNFVSENGTRVEGIDQHVLDQQLNTINSKTNSYAYLEKEDQSYIQVGGGPIEYTVEVRKYFSEDEFVHKKAQRKNSTSTGIKQILIGGSQVEVQSNQVMNLEEVILLFHAFLDGEEFSEAVDWDDMTEMFL